MTKSINAKIIKTKLKYGWTIQDFSNYFELDEEHFIKKLFSTFDCKIAKSFKQEMEANCKKRNYNHSNSKQVKSSNQISENNLSESESIENNFYSELNTSENTDLDNISNLLDTQRQDVLKLEQSIKVLSSKKLDVHNVLLSEKKKLKDIIKQLKPIEQRVNNKIAELREIKEEIGKSKLLLKSKKDELIETEKKFKDLSKVSILVYSQDFEISNFDSSVPESNNSFVQHLLEIEPLSENLTIKQLKLLSQLVPIVENVKDQGLTYEISFENDAMEQVFNSVLQNWPNKTEEIHFLDFLLYYYFF